MDTKITFTIPEAKVSKALEGFLKLYPNEEKTTENPPKLKYTDQEWVKECIRRSIIRDIRRGLQVIANEQANSIPIDNTLIT